MGRLGIKKENRTMRLSIKQPIPSDFLLWCRLEESNPRPTDYDSVALPTELSRRNFKEMKYRNLIRISCISHLLYIKFIKKEK